MKLCYQFLILSFGVVLLNASNLYTPNEDEFYKTLTARTHDWIVFNTEGPFKYTQTKRISVTGDNTINILFSRDISISNTFLLENLTLSGYENINIWIRHKTGVTLKNCTFNFKKNGGIKFYFENEGYLFPNSPNDTRVIIDSCTFNSDCSSSDDAPINQLFFTKDIYPTFDDAEKNYGLRNVKIINSDFNIFNYPDTIHNYITSIHFYRPDSTVFYADIEILNSNIDFSRIKNAITDGILFDNNKLSNFRALSINHYQNNKNIKFEGNYLNTDSNDPAHAVFIQGPYDSVVVSDNKMYRFGANFLSDGRLHLDGAIHLYGARTGKYCDDIRNSVVNKNTVHAVSSAIQLLGSKNSVVDRNKISMLPYPGYWINKTSSKSYDKIGIIVATGDYENDSRQSENITISNNLVNCNGEEGVVGIMSDARNFNIVNNRINNPDNYGIIYWGHKAVSNLDIGSSHIINNIIDFGNHQKKTLKAHFYSPANYNGMEFSGIHFYRMNNGEIYEDESLTVENNQIIKDDSIKKISIVDYNAKPVNRE